MRAPSPARQRGFTLLEVILASVIFVILAGGVYVVVSTCISATRELGEEQIASREVGAVQDFLRKGFLNLPAESTFILRARERGSLGYAVELVIRPAADALAVGAQTGGGLILGTEPDGKGLNTFAIARFPEKTGLGELNDYLDGTEWLPMLTDVEKLRWRFWDKGSNTFVETWDRGGERPELIELTIKPAGQSAVTSIFRVPAVTRSASSQMQSKTTP